MMNWLRRFMSGRYGVDQLTYAILFSYFIIFLVSIAFPSSIWYWVTVVIILVCYFRIFSRNIYKRQQENAKFLRFWNPIKSVFSIRKQQFQDRKTHKYYTCPNCKKEMRVPKGKGEITIKCPKCGTRFDGRT